MEKTELINKTARLINNASTDHATGRGSQGLDQMVKLRELLNAQPELEAGGATRQPEAPETT